MMITLETLEERLNELVAQRDQLIGQIVQAQANVNAFNGAIEEVSRLRDLLAAEVDASAPAEGQP